MLIKKGISSLPAPFARALKNDRYDPGDSDFTVTGLLSPPQKTYLAQKGEKIESGYFGIISILGSGVHNVLQMNVREEEGEFAERRLYHEMHGLKISGQIDFYQPGEVHDWKITSNIQEKAKPEHKDQVQMNGYLTRMNGFEVNHVVVDYMDRAWNVGQAAVNPSYSQNPLTSFTFPYDEEYAIKLFNEKIKDHVEARNGNPRPCTDEERWKKPDTWALIRPGNKRASKVCLSLGEAENEKQPGQIIQFRKGESTHCKYFCGYRHICPQYQNDSSKTQEED